VEVQRMKRYVAIVLLLGMSTAWGKTVYVNNLHGNDRNNGLSPRQAVATVERAVHLLRTSDTLSLADTGRAYREPILLRNLGGTPEKPLVIEGNGAVITGLKPIRPSEWQMKSPGVHFFPAVRFGALLPFLVEAGKRIPESPRLESLKEETFFWAPDGVYFRPAAGKSIQEYALEGTLVVSGLEIVDSSYIVCRNLISEYNSNDGFNIHGDCRGLRFDNIVGRNNGDDGFSIHETGDTQVFNGYFHHNQYGMEDVNASQSSYHGVRVEQNKIGAHFAGGCHSLIDCVFRDNAEDQIFINGNRPAHLIGYQFNPLCDATCQLKYVTATGGVTGLHVGQGARVAAEHCLFSDTGIGVAVDRGGNCHLTASRVLDCRTAELSSSSTEFYRDHNRYRPGRFVWQGVKYEPAQWEAFRAAALYDEHSVISAVR